MQEMMYFAVNLYFSWVGLILIRSFRGDTFRRTYRQISIERRGRGRKYQRWLDRDKQCLYPDITISSSYQGGHRSRVSVTPIIMLTRGQLTGPAGTGLSPICQSVDNIGHTGSQGIH